MRAGKPGGSHHDDEPEDLVDDPAPRHGMVLSTVAIRRKVLPLTSDDLPNLVGLDSLPAEVFRRETRVERGEAGLKLSPVPCHIKIFNPTSCRIKSATVMSSFPFWLNSGQCLLIL